MGVSEARQRSSCRRGPTRGGSSRDAQRLCSYCSHSARTRNARRGLQGRAPWAENKWQTFERDDRAYREARAVETFNGAAAMVGEYKRLQPAAQSACPHVALCVVPRQMVEHGDPGRRGTDHSESYGASIKDGIHRRCLRRKKQTEQQQHKRLRSDGSVAKTWMQRPLSVSRVMQTFRDMAVRERLFREIESVPYMLWKH